MSKDIFQTFPINAVVEWESDNHLVSGWVTGYGLNSVGEIVVEIKLIQPIERGRGRAHIHPYNRMTRLTAVVSGEYLYEG